MKYIFFILQFISIFSFAQEVDSTDNARLAKLITLSETVIRSDLNVSKFIERIKNDTSFYKAFKNLRVLNFSSLNDIRVLDETGKNIASLFSKTRQYRFDNCRTMEVLEEKYTGDFFDKKKNYNYYTAELYASLFFTKGKICGETNIVKNKQRDVKSKKGIEKRKEQLKMLFFDPGKKITGIPLMGDKAAIFLENNLEHYNFSIEFEEHEGQNCYKFEIIAKENSKNQVVIDKMTTWFNSRTMQIVARNYELSYNAGIYNFDVQMEVKMKPFGELLVPQTLRYIGFWDLPFHKKEKAIFTATLFDFSN